MPVEHRESELRFCIVHEGKEAELTYELPDAGRVNFLRTYVPFSLRGKGYAELLVEAGLGWAKDRRLQVETCCWYVEKFLPAQ